MEQQIRQLNSAALDPAHSAVIEACAGSGKTWLLVSRVVRVLLAGARPSEILAITFTRKAAQEMQARLHEWLHFLAIGSDTEIKQFLRDREVPEGEIDAALPRARALFETFLTDLPGITVSTFHGWFLQLLKRAPLAAGSANGASLVDQESSLIDEAWDQFADGLQRHPDSQTAVALNWLLENYGLASTRSLLTAFVNKRTEWWAFTRASAEPVQFVLEQLRGAMAVSPDEDVIETMFADPSLGKALDEYADLLERNEVKSDVERAGELRRASGEANAARRFELVWPVLMTGSGQPRVRKATDVGRRRLGDDGQQRLLSLHGQIGSALERTRVLLDEQTVYRLNEAGLACGAELLMRYESIKRNRGVIDYTDVEWRSWLLLTTSDYAEYMHYRLDARYRHILLDEFQDTNPLQWQILKAWLEASAEVESRPRVFLVGDPKQSIYRFRRAEPRLFEVGRKYLCERHGARKLEQNVTRRNAPAIVSVVNSLFTGLASDFKKHQPYQVSLPGRVELLPLFDADNASGAGGDRWRNPLDAPRSDDSDRRRVREAQALAQRIGTMVGRWQIADGERLRTLRFEDIHILVRARTHLDIYERALREAQIPYIGSRQGGLLDTLEASDLTALLQFLVVPFADIHLATTLRSPVFSVTDDDLLAISAADGGSWWQRLCALVREGGASEPVVRAQRLLSGWIEDADLRPVHDLLDRIYFEADVMRRYEAAVPVPMQAGVAANLRAFMEVALSTDSGRYPSLQGFLHQLESMRRAAAEEAPDVGIIAEGTDAVRILTVHGAKGLEAPVVWLLDANAANARTDSHDVLVDWPPEAEVPRHFSLFSRKKERGESRAQLFEQDALLAERENLNLLYVALTRARQVLIVSGIGTADDGESWYGKLAAAVHLSGNQAPSPALDVPPVSDVPSAPPLSRTDSAPAPVQMPMNIGMRTDDLVDPRRRHGTLVHALLEQVVPPASVTDRAFLRRVLGVSAAEFDALWDAVQSIVTAPSLSRFFDPGRYQRAINELSYVSENGELRRIDRVVEFSDDIWVLDYKTSDVADQDDLEAAARPYRKQLDEYCAAVSKLMPGKTVKSGLIFSGGELFEFR
jgi:ATP-dependent helicase/nuclease subunit A